MESLAQSLYVRLRDGIVTASLPGDAVFSEMQVAQRYGVSKITARETLKRLCAEKYLISYPRRGYMVNEISSAQCAQLQQVRYQVEAFAMREIIRRADDGQIAALQEILAGEAAARDPYGTLNYKFHMAIARLSQSEYVEDAMHSFLGLICRYALTSRYQGQFAQDENHHRQMTEAMLRRDIPAALEHLRLDLCLDREDL